MTRALAGPILLALALRAVPILVADRDVADVHRYQRMGQHLLDVSWNPYETKRLYPYPPLWAGAEAGAEWLARRGLGSFPIDVKLPILLADLLIVGALVVAGREGRAPPAAAWVYAAHPVSILVTGFHGQFDAIALLFVLMAVLALDRGRRDRSALWLAAGIATKSFPVLLVPFLALAARRAPRGSGPRATPRSRWVRWPSSSCPLPSRTRARCAASSSPTPGSPTSAGPGWCAASRG